LVAAELAVIVAARAPRVRLTGARGCAPAETFCLQKNRDVAKYC
jgi:hypothetical protein